jgi:hypothetical protein
VAAASADGVVVPALSPFGLLDQPYFEYFADVGVVPSISVYLPRLLRHHTESHIPDAAFSEVLGGRCPAVKTGAAKITNAIRKTNFILALRE